MKEIKAFIRPIKASEVCRELRTHSFCCMTLTECEGTGMYSDPSKDFPTFKFPFMHSKVVKIEIVCPDEDEKKIVELIQKHGKTGHAGDGIIYIVDVREIFKVRNGESGKAAC